MIQSGTFAYVETHETHENTLSRSYLWSLSRTVKFLCGIDFLLLFFYIVSPGGLLSGSSKSYSIYDYITLVLFVLPICGYIGAHKYNRLLLCLYLLFNIWEIVINIYEVNLSFQNESFWISFMGILSIIINIWIIELVYKLIIMIKRCNMENMENMHNLRNNWRPDENTVWVLY